MKRAAYVILSLY